MLIIQELKKTFKNTEQEITRLESECLSLRNEFKAKYPANRCPVYLARQSGMTRTPLFWRYSSQKQSVLGNRVKCFWEEIKTVSKKNRLDLTQIEYNRIELNWKLSMAIFKKRRLEILLQDFSRWLIEAKK